MGSGFLYRYDRASGSIFEFKANGLEFWGRGV